MNDATIMACPNMERAHFMNKSFLIVCLLIIVSTIFIITSFKLILDVNVSSRYLLFFILSPKTLHLGSNLYVLLYRTYNFFPYPATFFFNLIYEAFGLLHLYFSWIQRLLLFVLITVLLFFLHSEHCLFKAQVFI